VPPRDQYPHRLSAVLSVIYLIYNEGYSASSGQRWIRDELCREALRLGRILAALVPDEPEAHGLVALMELQTSRFAARTDDSGRPVLLEDQDRAKWDRAQIGRGVEALRRAAAAIDRRGTGWGPYALQAALAECHATAPSAAETDWHRIVTIYDALLRLSPSPVVELNRAVAVAMADDPAAALALVDGITGLAESYLLPSVRGELLARLGRTEEAAAQFERAAALTDNEREREVLSDKAARMRRG
jgi:predicted RNA polymerase sigma factor